MNPLLLKEVQTASSKFGAYYGLLDFRYKNLCVKADPFSLLPVTIQANLYECNIEEVASVLTVDDFRMAIYPNDEMYLVEISKGVLHAHPEFKQTLMLHTSDGEDQELNPDKLYDQSLKGVKYLIFTMPEVDKNRYDLLTNGVKSLHDECMSRVKVVNMQTKAQLTNGSFLSTEKDIQEAEARLKELYDKTVEQVDKLKDDKLDEIEEAYQKYLEDHEVYEEPVPSFDVIRGMKFGETE